MKCDSEQWSLQVTNSQDPLVEKQRWIRKSPSELSMEWLMAEPQVETLIAHPELGIPIQLELLLHPKALEFFLQDSVRLSWLEPQTVGDHICQRILATAQDRQFQLWIDSESHLLRRVDFPLGPTKSDTSETETATAISLILHEAEIDSEGKWSQDSDSKKSDVLLVRQYVAPPAPLESAKLGTVLDDFSLDDLNGKTAFESFKKRATPAIFCWLANHPASQRTAKRLNDFLQQARSRGLDKHFQLFAIWTESFQDPAEPTAILKSWNCDLPLLVDDGKVGFQRMGVQNAPTVVLIDPNNKLQAFVEQEQLHLEVILGSFLDAWIEKRDIAQEKLTEQAHHRNRFVFQMHLLAWDRATRDLLPKIEPFPPQVLSSRKLWTRSWSESLLSACIHQNSDASKSQMIAIDQRGQLLQWNGQGEQETLGELPAEAFHDAAWIDILPSPGSDQTILVVPGELDRFLLVKKSKEPWVRRINLHEGEFIVGAEWTLQETDRTNSMLYLATSKNRILVFSNQGEELLSGDSQGSLKAIAHIRRNDKAGYTIAVDGQGNSHPILLKEELPPSSLTTKLPFLPQAQRWLDGHDRFGSYCLAVGDSLEGGRFVYMLDSQLAPLWHLPVSQVSQRNTKLLDRWTVPETKELYWLVQSPREVLSIIRADGQMLEPMSWGEPIVSAGWIGLEKGVAIVVVFADRVESFQIDFPVIPPSPSPVSTGELVPAEGGSP